MLTAVPTQEPILPGLIDYTSSSFGAIFPCEGRIMAADEPQLPKRTTHLPDLSPFIQLITEKCRVKPIHLAMALIYVRRFRKALPAGYKADADTAHRIFAASLLVASKYADDHCLTTRKLVRATGDVWSIKEMARMELAFLRFLGWDLSIRPEELRFFMWQAQDTLSSTALLS